MMPFTKCLLPILVLLLSACALQPLDVDAGRVQEQIRSGEVLAVGDQAYITTRDGVEHVVIVSSVEGGYVHGHTKRRYAEDLPPEAPGTATHAIDIPVDDIVRVEVVNVKSGLVKGIPDDALFVAIVGVLMVIAAFATF